MFSSLRSTTVASIGNRSIDLLAMLRGLHFRGQLKPLLYDLLIDEVIADYAKQFCLEVSDEELQHASDQFRRGRAMLSAAVTASWLRQRGMTVLDFERFLESALLKELVFQHVTRHAQEAFDEQKNSWDRVELRVIHVAKQNLADELLSQLVEDGADFLEMARKHSQHSSAQSGGRLDPAFRRDLPADLAAALISAQPGEVVGPLKTADGWAVFRVENLSPAVFDQSTQDAVRSSLYSGWLMSAVSEAEVTFPLIAALENAP